MEAPTRALVVPVFRRYWLWHAWQEGGGAAAVVTAGGKGAGASKPLRDWREGVNLEEKAQLLGQRATRWVSGGGGADGKLGKAKGQAEFQAGGLVCQW